MSIFEYNEEEETRKLREGEQEIGEKRGRAESILEVLALHGQVPEYVKSHILAEDDMKVLSARRRAPSYNALHGQVPEYVKSHILAEDDMKVLSAWLREAAKAESIEDFLEKTGLKESCNS